MDPSSKTRAAADGRGPWPDAGLPPRPSALGQIPAAGRSLLASYDEAMELMAAFERIEHSRTPVAMDTVKRLYERLHLAVRRMLVALGDLGDARCDALLKDLQRFVKQTTPLFEPGLSIPSHPTLLDLAEIHGDMTAFVGQKAAHLAVIGHTLGLPVPDGFVLTAKAFDRFMTENELPGMIEAYLHGISVDREGPLDDRCESIRRLILQAPVPDDIEAAVTTAVKRWCRDRQAAVFTAVRSTAVGEDTEVSFAGQFATLLNVPTASVLAAYKEVIASKYSAGAIRYRMRYGLDDRETPMAVMIMEMIPAMASGVIYTRHPSQPGRDDLQISAIRGLGEYLMGGGTAPHVLDVARRTGRITARHAARQTHWMTPHPNGGTRLAPIPAANNRQDPLDASSARCLASWGDRLEKHFGAPQDVEWALDAQGRLFVLQSRPLGLDGPPATPSADVSPLEKRTVLHCGGHTACSGMVSGRIHHAGRKQSPPPTADSILVIPKAAPEYAPIIGRVRGVIAARGSAASHLASVAREFGVPMIVDTGPDVDAWPEGHWVTLHADTATVYDGRLDRLADEPRRALWRPLETPLRRRLRALSNRIVPRSGSLEVPLASAETPVTLHDLLERAHGFAVGALQGFPSQTVPVRVFHWSADNAAGDFAPRLHADTPPGPQTLQTGTRPGGPEDFLGALWSGLARPRKGDSQPPLLRTGGWALVTDRALRATAAFGVQQAIVDVSHPADPTTVGVRLRIVGGDGPFYKRCLRAMFLRRLLVDMGFEVLVEGALLDAGLLANSPEQARRLLMRIGELLIFCRRTDDQLTGPWAVEALHRIFQKAQDVAADTTVLDLPPALTVLAGRWRQATLDGRSVIVQDGTAGADGFLADRQGCPNKAQGRFFEHLHRDHFIPLAVVSDSRMRDGRIDLGVHLVGGRHACAGGVAFGYRDPGHCFLMGIDALRECLTLYEMRHGRRFKRLRKRYPVHRGRWYDIALRITALSVQIHLDGAPVMAYTGDDPITGLAGLWARDDTLAVFDGLTLMAGTRRELCV